MDKGKEQEEHLVAAGRGKWSKPGVPHRGWICVDIEDLGEPQIVCEMCESQTIRYVHHMEHPHYSDVLRSGCVCAGNMEGDIAAARVRESSMQSRTAKRKRWITRNWKISAKGNPWIRADGYRVTVYPRGGSWAATVSTEDDSLVQHSRSNYPNSRSGKIGGL